MSANTSHHAKPRRPTLRLPPEELKRETRSSCRLSVPEEAEHAPRSTPLSKHSIPCPLHRPPLSPITHNDTHSIASVQSLHSNRLDHKHTASQKPQAFLRDLTAHALLGFSSLILVAFFAAPWVSWHEPTLELHQLQEYFTITANSINKKMEIIDKLASNRVEAYRMDMETKIGQQANAIGNQLDALRAHISEMGSSLSRLQEKGFLSMDNALQLINSIVEKKGEEQRKQPLSLDDVKAVARTIVELELGKHEADGVGKVDYALASGGGKVIGHSEGFSLGTASTWKMPLGWYTRGTQNHPLANKILEPSLGEPGQCLPLAGSNAHVDISLRTAIYPQEITLEHVSKNVAYDISSAPKDFRIYGWQSNPKTEEGNWILLGEFSYDMERHHVQTFSLSNTGEGKLFNRIRLHVISNYGSQSHTCIYRLRLHGSEPSPKP